MADENQEIFAIEDDSIATPSLRQADEDENEAMTKEMLEEQRQLAEAMRLPQAPIDRIIKEVLPQGMHVNKETRAIFSRAVSVFIICLGTAAHDSALASKRKGILEKDVISGIKKMHLNIPEITTVLNNFVANAERQKQQKKNNATVNEEETADDETLANEVDATNDLNEETNVIPDENEEEPMQQD